MGVFDPLDLILRLRCSRTASLRSAYVHVTVRILKVSCSSALRPTCAVVAIISIFEFLLVLGLVWPVGAREPRLLHLAELLLDIGDHALLRTVVEVRFYHCVDLAKVVLPID